MTTGYWGSPPGTSPFVPSTGLGTSIGLGLNSLSDDTTGIGNTAIGYNSGNLITTGTNNTIIGQSVCSTTLATGSNNIIIGTSASADAATSSTNNSFWIGGGSTAIMSATSINSTPVVTIPGSLTVTGTTTLSSPITGTFVGVGATVGGSSSGFTNTGSTLASITGLSLSLAVGTYTISGYLAVQCAATPGIKLSLSTSTATATSILVDTWAYSTSTLTAESNYATAALTGNLLSSAVAATAVDFTGTIVVSTAGTLTLQAAQNTSNATVLTITNGSYITATRIA